MMLTLNHPESPDAALIRSTALHTSGAGGDSRFDVLDEEGCVPLSSQHPWSFATL